MPTAKTMHCIITEPSRTAQNTSTLQSKRLHFHATAWKGTLKRRVKLSLYSPTMWSYVTKCTRLNISRRYNECLTWCLSGLPGYVFFITTTISVLVMLLFHVLAVNYCQKSSDKWTFYLTNPIWKFGWIKRNYVILFSEYVDFTLTVTVSATIHMYSGTRKTVETL